MIADYRVPNISTKDDTVVIKHSILDFFIQDVFDAIRGKVDLNKIHSDCCEGFDETSERLR